ncbi:MAG: response regulator [Betaproteobacteria bacterium HGW-Betaproteobacteria-21]|nr:MAG: response regulator [Betaproteobacteria bacterium HGW-Betaproteobacteria-21]
MHVLIVDDQAANRLLPSAILRKQGCTVTLAASGEEALDYLSREKPDSVLLDISMPGISGEEVCERIRQDPRLKDLHVVAYTAHAMKEEKNRIMERGFDDLLIKPITINELLTVLGLQPGTAA